MFNFLQINLGVCRLAQDLMHQTAKQNNIDYILVSEQYRNGTEDQGWYGDSSGKAEVVVTKQTTLEIAGPVEEGFRWIQAHGIRIYSVYCSPNVTMVTYDDFLGRLEVSVRIAEVHVIIAGDFNAKRPEWGSPTSDSRGDALADLMSSLNLQACNTGNRPTFVRAASQSFIDITFAAVPLLNRISDWRVLEEESASLH